jgi:TPP-dependent pyruvate/acetoin dehydrogenase alpha subunit
MDDAEKMQKGAHMRRKPAKIKLMSMAQGSKNQPSSDFVTSKHRRHNTIRASGQTLNHIPFLLYSSHTHAREGRTASQAGSASSACSSQHPDDQYVVMAGLAHL